MNPTNEISNYLVAGTADKYFYRWVRNIFWLTLIRSTRPAWPGKASGKRWSNPAPKGILVDRSHRRPKGQIVPKDPTGAKEDTR